MDEIFPSLSWMIYFPCEGHFARQCLCSALKSSKRTNTLILMVRHKYLIKVYSSLRNYISLEGYLWKYFVYIQEKCSLLASQFWTTTPFQVEALIFFTAPNKSYPWRSWNTTDFVTRVSFVKLQLLLLQFLLFFHLLKVCRWAVRSNLIFS